MRRRCRIVLAKLDSELIMRHGGGHLLFFQDQAQVVVGRGVFRIAVQRVFPQGLRVPPIAGLPPGASHQGGQHEGRANAEHPPPGGPRRAQPHHAPHQRDIDPICGRYV